MTNRILTRKATETCALLFRLTSNEFKRVRFMIQMSRRKKLKKRKKKKKRVHLSKQIK